ncbi:MAG: hypothetical protein ACXWAT_00315 [Methylobacter sp.]
MKDVEFEGQMTPWLRFCVGVAILLVSSAPILFALPDLIIAIRGW